MNVHGCYQVVYRVAVAPLTGNRPGMPTQRKQQKDVVARLSESGEEALQKLLQNPGTAKVVGAANAMKERVDELTRRMRSLDPLEKRVAELERRLDELVEAEADGRKADDDGGQEDVHPQARREEDVDLGRAAG